MRFLKAAVGIFFLLCLLTNAFAETLDIAFPAAIGGGTNKAVIEFDEAWFQKDSDSYDHNIARVSLGMAVAAFRSETITYRNSDSNIRSFFLQAGFDNYEAEQFEIQPTDSTIASAIASRKLSDGSTLVAIAVSGQGYKNEWMSNFAVGGDETHSGFRNAAGMVFERFIQYLDKYSITGRVRVWTSGFSRAAATANLLAARLIQDNHAEDNDIFAYTFGTPSTTKTPIDYPQIYNICNSFDPVAFIPFSNWRYKKHGNTLYLPAAEVDVHYYEKLPNAREAYENVTGSYKGFYSNVNANWLLSKIMELLYRVLPESEFYSEAFQQTLINTWAVDTGFADRFVYLVDAVSNNNLLMTALKERSAGAGTLVAESLYNVYMEIAGKRSGKWADLFTGASQLVHEHEPSIYLSWLMSTDDPQVLFDHPKAYTRMILSADLAMTVEDSSGEPVTMTNFSRFTLNGQIYYAIPDGDYTVHLRAEHDTEGVIAFRYCDIRSVSENLYKTDKMHYYTGDELTVTIGAGGQYSVVMTNSDIILSMDEEKEIMSIADELTLTDSDGIAELAGITEKLLAVVIPHVFAILILALYIISMGIYKLVMPHRNEIVDTHRIGRRLLLLVAAGCIISSGRHLFFFFSELLTGVPELENRTAIRAAELLGVGTAVYQITDAIMYALLGSLAWRGRNRRRSRIRGRRLAGMFVVIKAVTAYGSYIIGTLSYYDIGCVGFFVLCFIAFIVVRDAAYEREMKKYYREEFRKLREERRIARRQKYGR